MKSAASPYSSKPYNPKNIGTKIPFFSDKPTKEECGQKLSTPDIPIKQCKQLAGTTL